jgi:hypothetical protein
LDYLDEPELKAVHWELGACIARALVGQKGYDMVAGHDINSGAPRSDLFLADKTSWAMTPMWFSVLTVVVEPAIRKGQPAIEYARKFRAWVAENVNSDAPRETHDAVEELSK